MPIVRLKVKGKEIELSGDVNEVYRLSMKYLNGNGSGKDKQEINTLNNLKAKMPTTKEVYTYIDSKDDYKHSMPEIQKHFLETNFMWQENKPLWEGLYGRILRAREQIAKNDGVTWIPRKKYDKKGNLCTVYTGVIRL